MKWENRDWFWLLGIIIFVSGTSFMYRNQVMNLISYTSTFVSIALAFIAIYISVREATKTDKIKDETLSTLIEIRERIGQVDTKVSSIDVASIKQNINDGVDQAFSNLIDKVAEYKKDEEQNSTPEDQIINQKVKGKLVEITEELKDELKSELRIQFDNSTENTNAPSQRLLYLDNALLDIYYSLDAEQGTFTTNDVFNLMTTRISKRIMKKTFSSFYEQKRRVDFLIDDHIKSGILSVNDDGSLTLKKGFKYSRI